MDSVVGFHIEEKNGKLFLAYHYPKYNPIPQTQSPTSSVEAARAKNRFQPLFLCPWVRWDKEDHLDRHYKPVLLNSSPEYVLSTTRTEQDEPPVDNQKVDDHHVLPLFWCNNKEVDDDCCACNGSNFGTDYYFCESHDEKFHKECVESPLQIKHPYHPDHSLQLYFNYFGGEDRQRCLHCGGRSWRLVYFCLICDAFMHSICALLNIPFVIDRPKRHDHHLTFFTRQTSLVCNVCGLLRKIYPTYICALCNFVAHNDCMYSPSIIKISRHHHRISYVSSLLTREWSCKVCHQSINGDYGAYTCDKCSDYVVHSRCALGKDVWDGEDLEGVPEKDYILQGNVSFDIISEGVIHHFLHDHNLMLEVSKNYDENKICQACVLPIYEGNYYSCMDCDFILHDSCANAPRIIQHALHPHPLTLKTKVTMCDACWRACDGFIYYCMMWECVFGLDVLCASISEPLDYEGHEHALFLGSSQDEHPTCKVSVELMNPKKLKC